MQSPSESRIGFIVPRNLVKTVKDRLQTNEKLDKTLKIKPVSDQYKQMFVAGDPEKYTDGSFYVPTTISTGGDENGARFLRHLLEGLGMQEYEANVGLVAGVSSSFVHASASSVMTSGNHGQVNLLARTISQWLATQTKPGETSTADMCSTSSNWAYTIYNPLLLLPASEFWTKNARIASKVPASDLSSLYGMLCKNFRVTHIAMNAPIPVNIKEQPFICGHGDQNNNENAPNILRSPTSLTPLYGNFGPALPLERTPTAGDFASAFWCTARQNGVLQIWAPRYTMFSRGNITEKTRILNLGSLTEKRLGRKPRQSSVVDLYAGIGYFAFSYARAGIGKVLCWEINSWSVEGLRKGAELNKWGIRLVEPGKDPEIDKNDNERILVFQESNEQATKRIDAIRDKIPFITHVNCGYLPSSKGSWEVAVQVLDPAGGWIHAHENIAKKDIESRKTEIVDVFVELVSRRFRQKPEERRRVECEHVELVKSYAPGVIHCVLDIAISPLGTNEEVCAEKRPLVSASDILGRSQHEP